MGLYKILHTLAKHLTLLKAKALSDRAVLRGSRRTLLDKCQGLFHTFQGKYSHIQSLRLFFLFSWAQYLHKGGVRGWEQEGFKGEELCAACVLQKLLNEFKFLYLFYFMHSSSKQLNFSLQTIEKVEYQENSYSIQNQGIPA